MDESPCYISQRPVASSQETNQGKSTQKNLPNKAIETHHMPGPPPGFINTFGAKVIHGDKAKDGRANNFISSNLSFNLDNDTNSLSQTYNEYPSNRIKGINASMNDYYGGGLSRYSDNSFKPSTCGSNLQNNSSSPRSTVSNDYVKSSGTNDLDGSSRKPGVPINYRSISTAASSVNHKQAPDHERFEYEYYQPPEKSYYSAEVNHNRVPEVYSNYKSDNDERLTTTNTRNKVISSNSANCIAENGVRLDEDMKKQQQQDMPSISSLYQTSAYHPQAYRNSPHRYGSSNHFYNTPHQNTAFLNPINNGAKPQNNIYPVKTAGVYPNNLYNNAPSVSLPEPSGSSHEGMGKAFLLHETQNERSENMYVPGGPTSNVSLRNANTLDKQIPITNTRGSPLINNRNLGQASRRQAIYLPPNSRQLYEEIAIVGSAGSSSGRSSVSRQQSPLENVFLQASGSKQTSRGNSSEVDILESPSRYSPAPIMNPNCLPSQQHLQQPYQTKPITEHYCSKPPLPPESTFPSNQSKDVSGGNVVSNPNGPRPPPRTRPKSWTSSLFNRALRNNHRSVTFQRVEEESGQQLYQTQQSGGNGKHVDKDHLIIADECVATRVENNDPNQGKLPTTNTKDTNHSDAHLRGGLTQAKQQMLFHSLPHSKQKVKSNFKNSNTASCEKTSNSESKSATLKSNARSRTPSPFRTIMKNFVRGTYKVTIQYYQRYF